MIIDFVARRILHFFDGPKDIIIVGSADYEEVNIRIRVELSLDKGPKEKSELNAPNFSQFSLELSLDSECLLDDGLDLSYKSVALIEPIDIQVASLAEGDEILGQQFVQLSLSCACRGFRLAGDFTQVELLPLIIDEQKDDFFSYFGSTKDIEH
jgi:hypothetical protein